MTRHAANVSMAPTPMGETQGAGGRTHPFQHQHETIGTSFFNNSFFLLLTGK